tara:strand:- start:22 stop:618 length:597 start_codon:yes stop_codon:yes gene_type:complete
MECKNDGEIKINTQMGIFLYSIAKNNTYKCYVETGSCRGNGSTFCLLKGLLERDDDSHLIGYETKKSFYQDSLRNNRNILKQNKKLFLKNKSLVSYDELPNWDIWNGNRKETYHYNLDLKQCETEETLENIDVLLLDAGGWSRQAEWGKYKNNIKIIILDDTKGSTKHIRAEIINDKSWKVLKDLLNDRCGWLAAEKI